MSCNRLMLCDFRHSPDLVIRDRVSYQLQRNIELIPKL